MFLTEKQERALFLRAITTQARIDSVARGSRISQARIDSDGVNLYEDFRVRLSQVVREQFADLIALDFVPMEPSEGFIAGSGSWIGQFLTAIGQAGFVSGQSTDLPLVSVDGATFTGKIASYALAGQWSQEDIFRAAISSTSIPIETMLAARRGVETKTDEIISLGSAAHGITGFLNASTVDVVLLTTGSWNTPGRTYNEVMLDFTSWISTLHGRVNDISTAKQDTVLLPSRMIYTLSGIYNTLGTKNAFQGIQELAAGFGITAIKPWWRLNTASTTGGQRMVAYKRSADCLGAIVPLPYMEFGLQERGIHLVRPAMASCGGVVVKQPKSIAYCDNVASGGGG